MARPCLCCNHPERDKIDAAIVGGVNAEAISKQYGITKQALWRHRSAHLPKAAIEAAKAERAEAEGRRGATLLEQAHELLDKARDLLAKAEDSGDIQTALRGVKEARECLVFIGRLTGDVEPDAINIVVHAQFVNFQQLIIDALAPYPDARAAVAARLAHISEQAP
ncbi:hypothetical protein ACNHKD_09135 [Methylocystis sp. JAN1]|uniref:hypothetical protein n=1 Tax=Methylocystis sp. JAN1 TaxID=3397211 RepID=UPI003FA317B1